VRVTDLKKGEAGVIHQGAYHVVENTAKGTTKFLQIFDHPNGGAVFAAPALAALPRNIVNSAFSAPVLAAGTTGKPAAIINVSHCQWW
jgi:oxalate decarboxylase/phosphoglucose isomerase-like protein (cupin superfamily)